MSNDLGQYLRLLREQQGLSTRQAAAALECSHSLIARFETGDRTPGLDRLWRLVELLAGDFGQALYLLCRDAGIPDDTTRQVIVFPARDE
jgi:transcriptional regulator with XRE-family HTH domain